jgi:hypothetical protein
MTALTTSVSGAPVLVYNPAPSGTPNASISNTGGSVAYIGQAGVTVASGLPLYPNQQIILPYAPTKIYAVSPVTATATATTTTAAANSAATTLAITSGTGTANGQQIQVGSGSNAEIVTIVSGGGTTTLTVTALNYDHRSGAAVTVMTASATSVYVVPGTV